jgi:hypothetical protein
VVVTFVDERYANGSASQGARRVETAEATAHYDYPRLRRSCFFFVRMRFLGLSHFDVGSFKRHCTVDSTLALYSPRRLLLSGHSTLSCFFQIRLTLQRFNQAPPLIFRTASLVPSRLCRPRTRPNAKKEQKRAQFHVRLDLCSVGRWSFSRGREFVRDEFSESKRRPYCIS